MDNPAVLSCSGERDRAKRKDGARVPREALLSGDGEVRAGGHQVGSEGAARSRAVWFQEHGDRAHAQGRATQGLYCGLVGGAYRAICVCVCVCVVRQGVGLTPPPPPPEISPCDVPLFKALSWHAGTFKWVCENTGQQQNVSGDLRWIDHCHIAMIM